MTSRAWLWIRRIYRYISGRFRFVVSGPPATYSILTVDPNGETRRDHLLNIVSVTKRLDQEGRGLLFFEDMDGHASAYSSACIIRIARRESIETKAKLWPKVEGIEA